MTKLIIKITKVIVATILAVILQSCVNFNGIAGDGNVVTTKRATNESFTAIDANTGLDVVIEQGNNTLISVEADENLQDHIKTEVKNGVLTVYSDASIMKSKAQKVYIRTKEVNRIKSSSGASITTNNEIASPELKLESSSGSEINIAVNSNQLSCYSSSGSEIKVTGKANTVTTDSSSGSEINLTKLNAIAVKANASSGSTTVVNASKEINANASSGSSIRYLGNPKNTIIDESSGGSVKQK